MPPMPSTPVSTATPGVTWDGTGTEYGGQEDEPPHPRWQRASSRLLLLHARLLCTAHGLDPLTFAEPPPRSPRLLHNLALAVVPRPSFVLCLLVAMPRCSIIIRARRSACHAAPHLRKNHCACPLVSPSRLRPASGSHDIALGRVATLQPAASDGVLVPCHSVSGLR